MVQSRKAAIKSLLNRCAPELNDWTVRGLVGSLKIPLAWVNEAKVRAGQTTDGLATDVVPSGNPCVFPEPRIRGVRLVCLCRVVGCRARPRRAGTRAGCCCPTGP